ncbi:ADP-ribosylation factor-like protein 2-binding protein [Diadema setosum]|uniref:ADP-ribosylation factor-like protein 2-binding protein n=1 Tax=Diadema setosum TaxID=31175 RepID=UPI003B3B9323
MATNLLGDGDHEEFMDFQEEELAGSSSNLADRKFDSVIGHIEDIIMEDGFQDLQNGFMNKHYHIFEDVEENKMEYTDIFNQYTSLIEKYIEEQLVARIPAFCMDEFLKQLAKRKDKLEGEIFEILFTFSDFLAFKELMLDFKADKEGTSIDLGAGIIVTPFSVDSASKHTASTTTSTPASGPPPSSSSSSSSSSSTSSRSKQGPAK